MTAGGDGPARGREAGRPPETDTDADSGATFDGAALDGPGRWCYAGEDPETVVAAGAGWIAVTTHRLLLFDPSDGGRRFLTVDRPNVLDVRVDASGTAAYLERVPHLVVYALVLLGGWVGLSTVDTGALLTAELPRGAGIGGLGSLLSTFRLGFSLLSTALLVAGTACVAGSVFLTGLYLRSRRRRVVVERAGAEPIEHELPAGGVDTDRLRAALGDDGRPEVGRDGGSESGNGDADGSRSLLGSLPTVGGDDRGSDGAAFLPGSGAGEGSAPSSPGSGPDPGPEPGASSGPAFTAAYEPEPEPEPEPVLGGESTSDLGDGTIPEREPEPGSLAESDPAPEPAHEPTPESRSGVAGRPDPAPTGEPGPDSGSETGPDSDPDSGFEFGVDRDGDG